MKPFTYLPATHSLGKGSRSFLASMSLHAPIKRSLKEISRYRKRVKPWAWALVFAAGAAFSYVALSLRERRTMGPVAIPGEPAYRHAEAKADHEIPIYDRRPSHQDHGQVKPRAQPHVAGPRARRSDACRIVSKSGETCLERIQKRRAVRAPSTSGNARAAPPPWWQRQRSAPSGTSGSGNG